MAATKGNQFWKIRSTSGRSKIFNSPEILWKAATEYFDWSDTNPLLEQKVFAYQGEITKAEVEKMRPYTITALCVFLGVNRNYLTDMRDGLDLNTEEGKEFSRIIKRIEDIVYTQKFEGAATDLLNASIIARDLGLADKRENTNKDVSYEISKEASAEEAAKIYNELMGS